MFAADIKAAEVPAPAALPAPDFDTFWKQIVEPVEPFLDGVGTQLLAQVQVFEPEIAELARYALCSQGKQLRPALVALSAGASGRLTAAHTTVAVIIEMVHLATLVHDDVMDEAEMRRRRPTLAANWGPQISVLLGDCLFAHALKLAASFPTPEVCRAVSGATNTVCSGEILQTLHRGNFAFSRTDYFRVLEMKTAELFALSCELGAALSGASAVRRSALRRYGLAFGTAYQVFDDCVDLFGSEVAAGKSLGTDLATGKLTLPVLLCLERASAPERARLCEWLRNWNPRHLPAVQEMLRRHEAAADSRATIQQLLDTAQQALTELPDTASRTALNGLTEFLVQQTDALGVSS